MYLEHNWQHVCNAYYNIMLEIAANVAIVLSSHMTAIGPWTNIK